MNNLNIINFRNYSKKGFKFSEGINIITGKNGTGKTNILEAIFFISTTASHRTNQNSDMLRKNKDLFKIKAKVTDERGNFDLSAQYEQGKGVRAEINSSKAGGEDLIRRFPVVLFSPEDIENIKGPPSKLRRIININICQLRPEYVEMLFKFRRLLKERNKLLKQEETGETEKGKKQLDSWTDIYKKHSIEIKKLRKKFIEKINEAISVECKELGINHKIRIEYYPSDFRYRESIKKDLRYGYTTWGPQRDVYSFFQDDIELKKHGSRGELRIAALIYRIAVWNLLAENKSKEPIVLLDDVFSELDKERRGFISRRIEQVQSIITSTEVPEELKGKGAVIKL